MKASELIEKLQALIEKHGDLPVTQISIVDHTPITLVEAFDAEGDYEAKRVHIHIF